MEQKKIDRINELAHKAKTTEGLTDDEKKEQAELRLEYVNSFKASLAEQLANTYIVRPDGTKEKLERKAKDENN